MKSTPNQFTVMKTAVKLIKCPLCRTFEKPHYHHLEQELNWYKNQNNNSQHLNYQADQIDRMTQLFTNLTQIYNNQGSQINAINRIMTSIQISNIRLDPVQPPVQPPVQRQRPPTVQQQIATTPGRRRIVRGRCNRCNKYTTRKCSHYISVNPPNYRPRERCSTYCCRNCDKCRVCNPVERPS